MAISVQNLYKQVISEEISVEKFMYTVRRDNVLSKYINNIMLFEDVVNVFKNKGFIWETGDKKEDESFNFIKSFSIIQESNKLKGGKGDKLTVDQVNFYEFTKGWKHELEHTDDIDTAKEIALDHLAEDPMYYTRLEMVEIQAKKKKRTDLPKEYSKKDAVDKDNATKPVKGFKKAVKDSTKRIDKKASKKPVGVKQLKGDPGALVSKPLNEVTKPKPSTNKEPVAPLSYSDVKFLVADPTKKIVSWMGKDEKVADKKVNDAKVNNLELKKYTPSTIKELDIKFDNNTNYTDIPVHALFLMLFGKIKNYTEFDKIKDELVKAKASPLVKRDIKNTVSKEDKKFNSDKEFDSKYNELTASREKFLKAQKEKQNVSESNKEEVSKWEGPGIYKITNKVNNKTVNVEIKTEIVFDRVINNPMNTSVEKVEDKKEEEKNSHLFIWRRKQDNNDSWGELTKDEYNKYKNDKDIQFIKPITQKELEKRDADKAKPKTYSSNAKGETKAVLVNKPTKSTDVKFMTDDEISKYKAKHGSDSLTIKNVNTDKTKVVTGGSKETNKNDLNKNFNKVPETDSLGIKKGVKLNPRDLASKSKWALFDPKEEKVIKFYGLGGRPEAEDDLSKNMGKGYLILPSLHPKVKKSLMEGEFKKKDQLTKYKGLELSFSISKLNKLVRLSGLYLNDINESKDKKFDFQIKLNDIDETTSKIKDGGYLLIKQNPNKKLVSIYNEAGNFYKVLDVDRNLDNLIKSLYKDNEDNVDEVLLTEFINTPVKSGPVVRLKELQREFQTLDKNDISSREPGTRQRANERLDKMKDIISKISFDESQLNDKQLTQFNEIKDSLKDVLNEDNSVEEYKELIKMNPTDLSDYVSKNIDSLKNDEKKIKLSTILLTKYKEKDPSNLKVKDALQKISK